MTDERRRPAGRRSDDVTLGEVWRLLEDIKSDLRELLDAALVFRITKIEDWKVAHLNEHKEMREERRWWTREGAKWVFAIVGAVLGALIISYLSGR